MSRLEVLDRETWEGVVNAPVAYVMLGKTDCPACNEWTAELESFLATDGEFGSVRFGKVLLDTPGLGAFKKANPWIADAHDLPYNALLQEGRVVKTWIGGGTERLTNRLRRVAG